MASKLTHPKFLKKKIYHVYLDRNVTAADLRQIAEGITLEDGDIRADAVDYASETDKKQVGIEIHSGKNRIVRRIFASLGYNVVKLDRVYFAGLTKKNVSVATGVSSLRKKYVCFAWVHSNKLRIPIISEASSCD